VIDKRFHFWASFRYLCPSFGSQLDPVIGERAEKPCGFSTPSD
jgi:hypothetical protein